MGSTPLAPERFARWLDANRHADKKTGIVYRYHSRSDSHSVALCEAVAEDLYHACPTLKLQADNGLIVYGINFGIPNPKTGKVKNLDLAIGMPKGTPLVLKGGGRLARGEIGSLLFSCEAKTVMTEHGKSKPRVYDELSSSHEIIHQGWPQGIATGITVINIAKTFVSPLRNQVPGAAVKVTNHKQPKVAGDMVKHLRGLQLREEQGRVGFDAFASIVVECDNATAPITLWTDPPAPQPGEPDHYETFLSRVSRFWTERFSTLPAAPR